MSRTVKELVAQDFEKKYKDLNSLMVVSVHGLKGTEVNTLRRELRKKQIDVHVIGNRTAKRVLADTILAPISSVLTGPCAFVTGGASPVDAAKELIRLVKEYPALELKKGLVEGETDLMTIEDISKRRSKAELQGDIVMLAISPGRRIAGCLNTGGRVAGCIKTIIDRLEKGETIAKVA